MLAIVAAWRGASELLERRRALAATGELDARIAARRHARISRAVAESSPRRNQEWAHPRALAREGSEVGLLRQAVMRSAAVERNSEVPRAERGPLLGISLGLAGVMVTVVALVNPLADTSPWLAFAGLSCVGAAAYRERGTR